LVAFTVSVSELPLEVVLFRALIETAIVDETTVRFTVV
jgi:hypothetical protein